MGKTVLVHLRPVRVRQQWLTALRLLGWGLLVGSLVGAALAVAKFFLPTLANWLPLAAVGVGALSGLVIGALWPQSNHSAAQAIDNHYQLKDRTATALEFADRTEGTTTHQLALDDALAHLTRVEAAEVVPLRTPKVFAYGVSTLVATALLMLIAVWNQPAAADIPQPLDTVLAQADRVAEELAELEEFARQEQDPALEKLVAELKAAIEEMKQPGIDVREAMAKLSEMQAALESEQSKQNAGSVESQMQAIGEALALAQPLAEAGQALSSGQYEKAAEELAKLETPELDRQTEKAIKEKLEALAKQAQNNGQNALQQALGEMSQGLGGEGRKFSEGSQKLASEAKKQGKRKKLTDLLQKQCNCLGECKSECEGESQSKGKGQSNRKGGKNWGLGASDGALGERTAQVGAKKQEKITGKQSDEGETEIETTHSPEGSQEAQRSYRENYAKYKKISESVLENEPIPLGHRQTIRKYFESIRPNDAETDAVQATEKQPE